jgi:hypothetical protein
VFWPLAACVIFGLSAWLVYGDVWRAGPTEQLPSLQRSGRAAPWLDTDQTFIVWQVSRNAGALLSRPHAFFDSGHCHPIENALAHTGPMLTMGILAIPATLLGANPVLAYNIVLVSMLLLAGWAMYWLVTDWTGVPAAGIVAGLLYGFHRVELANVVHPHIYDTTWTVFALGFGRRLFAHGRWRDAAGLAASAALQVGTSFYPFVASVLLALPFGVWLVLRHRLRRVGWRQIGFVLAAVGLAGAFTFAPYLLLRGTGELPAREAQLFAWPVTYLPGEALFFGWPCLVLAGVSLVVPRSRIPAATSGDPRWALLAGLLLVAAVAAGPRLGTGIAALRFLDLWGLLGAALPGFDNVRNPRIVAVGAHLAACVLAGIGCAALLRLWRWRRAVWLGLLAIALVWVDTLRPAALGFDPPVARDMFRLAPDPEALAFFETLEEKGNSGPIFEMPLPRLAERGGRVVWGGTVDRLYLAGYHGRRTSACFGAHVPDRLQLEEIALRLPAADAEARRDSRVARLRLHDDRLPPRSRFRRARAGRDTGDGCPPGSKTPEAGRLPPRGQRAGRSARPRARDARAQRLQHQAPAGRSRVAVAP